MSQWKAKIYTPHVLFRQNGEEKVRGKGVKAVWDDENEWNTEEKVQGMGLKAGWDDTNEWSEEEGRKTEKKGPKVLKSA